MGIEINSPRRLSRGQQVWHLRWISWKLKLIHHARKPFVTVSISFWWLRCGAIKALTFNGLRDVFDIIVLFKFFQKSLMLTILPQVNVICH